MANFSLLELGQNDELTTVIKKSNMNFRNLGWALKQKIQQASDGSSEWKQAIADLRDETEQEVSTLTQTINALSDQLTKAETTMKRMVPPIGTILLIPDNPNTMYPGTTWKVFNQVHQLTVGNPAITPQYFEPLDADGNSLMPATTSKSTSTAFYSSIWVQAWYRTK